MKIILPSPRVAVVTILSSVLIILFWSIRRIILATDSNEGYVRKRGYYPSDWSWIPADFTLSLILEQLKNPGQITTILLLVGGDLVQKAVSQMSGTGTKYFRMTPVIFSYGWVSFAFTMLASAYGNHGFFAAPDHHGVVVSLTSGDKREIRSWVLGRLLRDLEHQIDPDGKIANRETTSNRIALHVRIFQIDVSKMHPSHVKPKRDFYWWSFALFLLLQFGIALIPMVIPSPKRSEPNFYVLLITFVGNALALLNGSIVASRVEKYGKRGSELGCKDMFAITRGSGHNIVIVIVPNSFRDEQSTRKPYSLLPYLDAMASSIYKPSNSEKSWVAFFAFAWLYLLLLIGGSTADNLSLLGVGSFGMIHTLIVASVDRKPEAHGIPLVEKTDFEGEKVQSTLIDLENEIPGAGYMLQGVFFNGPQNEDDRKSWDSHFEVDYAKTITHQGKTRTLTRDEQIGESIKNRLKSWKDTWFANNWEILRAGHPAVGPANTSTAVGPANTSTAVGPANTSTAVGPANTSTAVGPANTSTAVTHPAQERTATASGSDPISEAIPMQDLPPSPPRV